MNSGKKFQKKAVKHRHLAVLQLSIYTPPKINGWNLEMMVSNRNLRDSKGPPFSGSMFVLGGVG